MPLGRKHFRRSRDAPIHAVSAAGGTRHSENDFKASHFVKELTLPY
jgi:hypothetical protein